MLLRDCDTCFKDYTCLTLGVIYFVVIYIPGVTWQRTCYCQAVKTAHLQLADSYQLYYELRVPLFHQYTKISRSNNIVKYRVTENSSLH